MITVRDQMKDIDKQIERLELSKTMAELFIYLSDNNMMVCTTSGPVDPSELSKHVESFIADRGES